ncbi:hypothetical protein SJ20_05810 [Micrococcus sp. MS-ASIII-49]|uniref:hypothetical protein n=1 Tax=Micrococcus sp. MS-ASIII-49 TaxID=1593237 RepID=UPI0005CC8155|nr:hypothetical protein [Micrococcus sp. MS-ASIII-49]RYD00111.1 hypothetical protein SJ20_05810 [Micrococcus sp. MS-ASIII-49]
MRIKFNEREWSKYESELQVEFDPLSDEASAAASREGTLDERTDAYCAVFAREGVQLDRGAIRAELAKQLGDDVS